MNKSFLIRQTDKSPFLYAAVWGKVDKKPGHRFKRIDPVDACVDAHAVMLKNKTTETVDVESELDKYLKAMGWKK